MRSRNYWWDKLNIDKALIFKKHLSNLEKNILGPCNLLEIFYILGYIFNMKIDVHM